LTYNGDWSPQKGLDVHCGKFTRGGVASHVVGGGVVKKSLPLITLITLKIFITSITIN